MKIKTSELQDAALDWAVNQIEECCDDPVPPPFSTSWAWGGPIIEQEEISIVRVTSALWDAHMSNVKFVESGPTQLIAAMRCFVASKLGDECDIPDELITGE